MAENLRLMCILPHPDDETLGAGGILAKYAAEGIETYLVMGTRGEQGWPGDPAKRPSLEELGVMRERELHCAAQALGVSEVYFLGYIDGEVAKASVQDAIARIVPYVREIRPQVVVTFDPFGVYGHPDHIAMGQYAVSAVMAAANPEYTTPEGSVPHSVSKLYFMTETQAILDLYQSTMGGEMRFRVDGKERGAVGWPEWAVSARIDIGDYWDQVVEAIRCHETQQIQPDAFAQFPEKVDRAVWGYRCYYRVFSLVNGGREVETDLFAGLR